MDSVCAAFEGASETIEAIDLRGEPAAVASPGRIFRLIDLARAVGTRYDLDANVNFVDNTPVVRVSQPR